MSVFVYLPLFPDEVIAWNYQGQFKALYVFSFKRWFEEIFKCKHIFFCRNKE